MTKNLLIFILLLISTQRIVAQETGDLFSIVCCPSENTEKQMNFSWGSDTSIKWVDLEVTPVKDREWRKSIKKRFEGQLCQTFDSVYSKTPQGKDFYEKIVFNKYNAHIEGLKKNTQYKYRLIANDTTDVRYFKTSGSKEWSACIIADFHAYAPLPARTEAAMQMIETIGTYDRPFEWILHLGDITAWGGSYSFWQQLYSEEAFKKYMWAGVNGNHDNMTRGYHRTTNQFFRDTATYPENGYPDEEGVCYYFYYGDVLFIMLNNESMREEAGLKAAQEWVKNVVKKNPAKYKVVCEHYQWFFGKDGKDSQYARWNGLFDELGIDLALAGNNHIYISSHALCEGKRNDKGTTYVQVPSSDNERGVDFNKEEPLAYNSDKIKHRWGEGAKTVGGMHMKVSKKEIILTLLDRYGQVQDVVKIKSR